MGYNYELTSIHRSLMVFSYSYVHTFYKTHEEKQRRLDAARRGYPVSEREPIRRGRSIRFTDTEWGLTQGRARAARLTIAEFVRRRVLEPAGDALPLAAVPVALLRALAVDARTVAMVERARFEADGAADEWEKVVAAARPCRGARPAVSASPPKRRTSISLTRREWARATELAAGAGMSVAEYIVATALTPESRSAAVPMTAEVQATLMDGVRQLLADHLAMARPVAGSEITALEALQVLHRDRVRRQRWGVADGKDI